MKLTSLARRACMFSKHLFTIEPNKVYLIRKHQMFTFVRDVHVRKTKAMLILLYNIVIVLIGSSEFCI